MSTFRQRFVIEIAEEAIGLVVQEQDGFRFFAASVISAPLDRRLYASPGHAEDACRNLMREAWRHRSRPCGRTPNLIVFRRAEPPPSAMIGG